MTFSQFIEQSGISLLMAAACFYFAWKLLAKHDLAAIRNKDKPKPKHEREYTQAAGRGVLFFGLAVLANAFIVLFDVYVGFIEIIIAVVLTIIYWKKISDLYE
ncbi:MAG: hypothetical protein LKF79_06185 [Solobacterium sp.]|jgi:hypothetical protein|nr:hypothetical protein [Solobacterium sp.]MCH4222892.1 hypothetical protein [Solobacterium sp.]MCH4266213.1 hypothetical protein [Solobacterium sp.]